MLKIGLTGGIGCGKSTVAQLFESHGAPVIDADDIARRLVEPGGPAMGEIAAAFGADVVEGGRLDRRKMRERVFASPRLKRKLEAILHPLVFQEMERQLHTLSAPYAILSIPLLLETESQSFVDRILVVDCSVELQYERVKARDNETADQVGHIIRSQASREARLRAADDIIVNNSDLSSLAEQVRKMHRFYLSLQSSAL